MLSNSLGKAIAGLAVALLLFGGGCARDLSASYCRQAQSASGEMLRICESGIHVTVERVAGNSPAVAGAEASAEPANSSHFIDDPLVLKSLARDAASPAPYSPRLASSALECTPGAPLSDALPTDFPDPDIASNPALILTSRF